MWLLKQGRVGLNPRMDIFFAKVNDTKGPPLRFFGVVLFFLKFLNFIKGRLQFFGLKKAFSELKRLPLSCSALCDFLKSFLQFCFFQVFPAAKILFSSLWVLPVFFGTA